MHRAGYFAQYARTAASILRAFGLFRDFQDLGILGFWDFGIFGISRIFGFLDLGIW
jgi:hypothetical protein